MGVKRERRVRRRAEIWGVLVEEGKEGGEGGDTYGGEEVEG